MLGERLDDKGVLIPGCLGQGPTKLFSSIVSFAVCDIELSVFHVVDEAVFIVDAAAVFTL